MIEQSTVFVLGAGASCSYGFPSGEQLKNEVVAVVQRSISQTNDNSFLRMQTYGAAKSEEVQSSRCRAFAVALANSGQASIDAFLNANRDQLGYNVIGKGTIAQVLLDYESREGQASDDDWLDYLFKVMLEGVNSPEQLIERNKVGFVTFNYDRLLETWLLNRIQNSFGLNSSAALKVLRKIPIHHVYGMLGRFPKTNDQHPVPWVEASKGIRTIFDTEHDQQIIGVAKSLLKDAYTICFLGFGFHRENIELLDLVEFTCACPGVIASSRFEVSDAEWARLTKPFSGKKIQSADWKFKCRQAVRNLPIF